MNSGRMISVFDRFLSSLRKSTKYQGKSPWNSPPNWEIFWEFFLRIKQSQIPLFLMKNPWNDLVIWQSLMFPYIYIPSRTVLFRAPTKPDLLPHTAGAVTSAEDSTAAFCTPRGVDYMPWKNSHFKSSTNGGLGYRRWFFLFQLCECLASNPFMFASELHLPSRNVFLRPLKRPKRPPKRESPSIWSWYPKQPFFLSGWMFGGDVMFPKHCFI